MDQRNRKRGLADVVGVEAWHQAFTHESDRSELHIDVVFQTARLGGDIEAPIRFKLGVKRAEVVVVLPTGEPVRVAPETVSRDAPSVTGQAKEVRVTNKNIAANANVGGGLSPSGSEASVKLGMNASGSASVQNTIDTTATITGINVVHMKTGDALHRWLLSPNTSENLEGRPWDSKSSRLVLIDTRKDRNNGLAPSIRVEIRCLREDLDISNIVLKDSKLWNIISNRPGHRNRIAAAEAFIRNKLAEHNLLGSEETIEDPFCEMVLASTIAEA